MRTTSRVVDASRHPKGVWRPSVLGATLAPVAAGVGPACGALGACVSRWWVSGSPRFALGPHNTAAAFFNHADDLCSGYDKKSYRALRDRIRAVEVGDAF
jgi:hypothetical protein